MAPRLHRLRTSLVLACLTALAPLAVAQSPERVEREIAMQRDQYERKMDAVRKTVLNWLRNRAEVLQRTNPDALATHANVERAFLSHGAWPPDTTGELDGARKRAALAANELRAQLEQAGETFQRLGRESRRRDVVTELLAFEDEGDLVPWTVLFARDPIVSQQEADPASPPDEPINLDNDEEPADEATSSPEDLDASDPDASSTTATSTLTAGGHSVSLPLEGPYRLDIHGAAEAGATEVAITVPLATSRAIVARTPVSSDGRFRVLLSVRSDTSVSDLRAASRLDTSAAFPQSTREIVIASDGAPCAVSSVRIKPTLKGRPEPLPATKAKAPPTPKPGAANKPKPEDVSGTWRGVAWKKGGGGDRPEVVAVVERYTSGAVAFKVTYKDGVTVRYEFARDGSSVRLIRATSSHAKFNIISTTSGTLSNGELRWEGVWSRTPAGGGQGVQQTRVLTLTRDRK